MASQVPNFAGTTEAAPVNTRFSWSGIFAGTFLFLAIEATFGMLAAAIFGPAASFSGLQMTIGPGIWMIVLTAIAMFFAGRMAARLSGATSRAMGMRAGLVTFGMSIFATILTIGMLLGGTSGGPVTGAGLLAGTWYWAFMTLIIAMFTSAAGGAQGFIRARPKSVPSTQNEQNEPRAAA